MSFSKALPILLRVITDKNVIIIVVSVILYLNFVSYVQHYHKRPPPVRRSLKRTVQAEKSDSAASENGGGNGNADQSGSGDGSNDTGGTDASSENSDH
ncbi:hypothetical protein HRI96_02370 [Treponema parvum]|uniref:Uncharacterized protein n=1 Tax=Treponema parvum TaxID=138851 RepID=A0A975EYP0_9SPIR|nr:hypothetical protein [Treponema parvum]QTQ11137.1 hypothetical protein HRI96_02370 [Treponema parvum]QTQ16922.1 hypothetical protein HXT04_09595 [Treponema parvum]